MKYEFLPGDPDIGKGFEWILTASSTEDQRFLTMLRDICMGAKIRPRVTGEKHLEKNLPGLPDRPVIALSMTLEDEKGTPYFPKKGQSVDPSQFVNAKGEKPSRTVPNSVKVRPGPAGSVVIEEK